MNLIRKITLLFFEIQLNRNNILNSYFNDFTVKKQRSNDFVKYSLINCIKIDFLKELDICNITRQK